jgi:PAS domain S-box-containing protein
MRRLASPVLGVALTLAAVLSFAGLLGFSLNRMVDVENAMRVNAEQNMLWVLHQSEVAALRLAETAALAELGEAGASDIILRFDILASRVAMLNDGPQRRFIGRIGYSDDLEQLTKALDAMAPMIAGFTPDDANRLRADTAPFQNVFGRAANAAMIAEWDDLGGRLETYRNQLRQTIFSLIGIMVAGGVLVISLIFALRQSHRRNSLLLRERDFSGLLISSSSEGILAVDRAGRCTLWNAAMAAMIGKSAEYVIDRKLTDVAGVFAIAPVQRAVSEALNGETSELAFQPFFHRNKDRPHHVDLRFSPMRDGGDIRGAIVFLHDAEDRYAAQRKDAQDRDRLEDLVAERTRDLDRALKREQSAANLYRNFAGMVSHQFRTPLAVVDSALQRLIRRGPRANPQEVAERAGRARSAIAGLTRLVDSTLDAARLDADQIETQRVACDMSEIIETVCDRQGDTAPDRKISVDHGAGGPYLAFCDPAHAEQIVENLLSNAAKYAPSETPILVTLHGNTQNIVCDVSNAGNPIHPREQEHIFERNFRGANSTGIAGTGIGLFMARTLARMQGGDLALHPGNGKTTFRLTLPTFDGDVS